MSTTNPPEKASIIIVDDEPQVREMLAEVLAEEGYEVRQAAGGQIALDIMKKVEVDLIVTDIIMPNQMGTDVILNVRKHSPNVRIIAMSGGGRIHDRRFLDLAKKAGANMVLGKPIDINVFVESVKKVLSSPSGQ